MHSGHSPLALKHARILILAIALGLSFFSIYRPIDFAEAHANLVRSEPAPNSVLDASPQEIHLWFSEAPEPRFSTIHLFDRASQPVNIYGVRSDPSRDTLLIADLPSLPPNVYTVVWRATSMVDGHVTQGSFAFTVGPAQDVVPPPAPSTNSTPPGLTDVAVHWLGYLSTLLLAGGFAYVPLILRPALNSANANRTSSKRQIALAERASLQIPYGLFPLLVSAWGLSLLGTFAAAVLQAVTSAGTELSAVIGAPLLNLLLDTRYGDIFWFRLLLFGLLGVLVVFMRKAQEFRDADAAWWTCFALSSFMLFTTSLNGHAAAGSDPFLPTVVDWLHLDAVGIWIGGLAALMLSLPWLKRVGAAKFGSALSHLVRRFSKVAFLAVIAICITGFLNGTAEVGDGENLFDTSYGTALLIKIGILALVIGLAAINLLVIRGKLARAARAPNAEQAVLPWYQRLRIAAGGEMLLIAAILVATSVLVGLPPAREAYGAGTVVRGQAADLRAVLVINPGKAGFNSFNLFLRDKSGTPIADAEKAAFIITMVGMDMGETEVALDNAGGGRYLAQGDYLPMPGVWQAEALIRRRGQDDVRIDLIVNIPYQED